MIRTALFFVFAGLIFMPASHAEEGSWFPAVTSELNGPYLRMGAAFGSVAMDPSRRSGLGGGGEVAVLWRPEGADLLAGPRVGVLFGVDEGDTRADLPVGVESTLWFANAVGSGFGGDYLVPLNPLAGDGGGRFRVEANLKIRLLRTSRFSALAPKLSVTYDFSFGWGALFGLSWQLGGVP